MFGPLDSIVKFGSNDSIEKFELLLSSLNDDDNDDSSMSLFPISEKFNLRLCFNES